MDSEGLTEIEKEMQKEIDYIDCLRNIKYYNEDYKEGKNQTLKKFLIEIKKDSLILLSGHDIQYIEFSDEIFKLDNMKLEKTDKQKLYEEIEKIG